MNVHNPTNRLCHFASSQTEHTEGHGLSHLTCSSGGVNADNGAALVSAYVASARFSHEAGKRSPATDSPCHSHKGNDKKDGNEEDGGYDNEDGDSYANDSDKDDDRNSGNNSYLEESRCRPKVTAGSFDVLAGKRRVLFDGVQYQRPGTHVCKHPDCGAKYTRLEHLRPHALKHTGGRSFVCVVPGCERSFSRNDNLRGHYSTHLKQGSSSGGGGGGGRRRTNTKMELKELRRYLGTGPEAKGLVQRLRKKLQEKESRYKRTLHR